MREQAVVLLNGYLDLPKDMSGLIATSAYGDDIGLMGALLLAEHAYKTSLQGPPLEEKFGMSAFNVGVIHGVVVGIAATYIGILLAGRKK